ncbi:MetQ/NlpA family ABC transporter substrate-binding protein [Micrococcus sp. M4NT]|uniref:MetQ/NlpA family ABC transporter substrate-binding protein n=1 Tax=Micrococcus sp. M4NT TaxID=2957501 RepID=UPI0029B5D0C9|nr:MetQ/NlpA family ABC transporter substrate-binding protein [Micrococcus sp. M4NT]MDX2340963.1 MetQ/NlpA family ABC transporter substrate-binding protein [Micrococcus sp. M4NT]
MTQNITRRSFAGLSLAAVGALALTACNSQSENKGSSASGSGDAKKVRIGVVSENETHRLLAKIAKEEHGIDVEIRNFTEYTQPNPALDNGDVDMNWFQHIAYLADYNQASGKDLTLIGTTEIIPLPLYSKKYKDLKEFQKGDAVAIPNDTVNQARAINVLVAAGLLKLKNDTIRPEVRDIDEAASLVKVQPVAAQQTVNALESVAGSIINNTFSADAGIDTTTALFKDDPQADSAKPFVNGFAVRRADRENETYKIVADLYHDERVLAESAKLSSDTSVPVKLDEGQIDETLKQYQDAIAKQGA